MNRVVRQFAICLGATVILVPVLLPGHATAYVTYNNHHLKGGVGDYGRSTRAYFITDSASGNANAIDNAVHDWIHTTSRLGVTTPVYWTKANKKSDSVMDIYEKASYSSSTGIIAATTFWSFSQNQLDQYSRNWEWGKVVLNRNVFPNLSACNREGSCAHEMGHVMGLDENNSKKRSVMCQLGAGRKVRNARKDDCNGINHLY